MEVSFYKHNLGEREKSAVLEVLDSTFLTTGPRTAQFERLFADYMGADHCVSVSSWTAGTFLVLKAWGIGPGDEVIVPSLTFISCANVVLHTGATVVFCDSDSETGNLDVAHAEALITERTKAIIPVHLYGQMADMREIRRLADERHIKVLEDSAHCVEGLRDDYQPGTHGDAAVFSFYATKNLTCGEGGAIITDDTELAEHLMLLRLHGMSKSAIDRYHKAYEHWDMELLGYKANLTDVQAAILIPQLEHLETSLRRREEICRFYEATFSSADIRYPQVLRGSKSARYVFTVWIDGGRRDDMLAYLQAQGIGVAVNFRAVHTLSYYQSYLANQPIELPVAERISEETLTIPLYPKLTDQEVEYVATTVVEGTRALAH